MGILLSKKFLSQLGSDQRVHTTQNTIAKSVDTHIFDDVIHKHSRLEEYYGQRKFLIDFSAVISQTHAIWHT